MREVAQLSEEVRALALSRYRLLQPHLEQSRTLRSIADEAGVSFRTLQRWVAQYRRFGLLGLVRKERDDVGGRRKLSPSIQVVVEGLALERPRLPIVSVHRRISSFARWMGEEPPSYWVVRDLVRQLPASLLTLAHEGPKAYRETFDLVHRREAPTPNAIWQADHAQLDILLVQKRMALLEALVDCRYRRIQPSGCGLLPWL